MLQWFELEEPERAPEPDSAPVTVVETKSKSGDRDDSSEDIADNGKPQEADHTENSWASVVGGSAVRVRDEHSICGSEDSQDVRDNVDGTGFDTAADPTQAAPPRLSLTSTSPSRRLDQCAQAGCDSLDCMPAGKERLQVQQGEGPVQESSGFAFEEAAERGVQAVEDDKDSRQEAEAEAAICACSSGCLPLQESEDSCSVSSPDSECAPLTPPPVLPCPPRPLVFGCITPEYLREMWEEEGPGAWMDSGVWASNVRLLSFRESYS